MTNKILPVYLPVCLLALFFSLAGFSSLAGSTNYPPVVKTPPSGSGACTILNFTVGHSFSEYQAKFGVSAYDPEDGDITASIVMTGFETVDTSAPGTYFVEFNAKDSQGLSALPFVREVNVRLEGETTPGRCYEGGNLEDVCTIECENFTECSDDADNDQDDYVDSQDPQCHTDSDPDNASSYDPKIESEAGVEPEPESVCGNELLEQGEQCDDGNTEDGDGCSSLCQLEPEPGPPSPPNNPGPSGPGGGGGGYSLIKELAISNEEVVYDSNNKRAIVSWQTNLPADSAVFYSRQSHPTATTTESVQAAYGQKVSFTTLLLGHASPIAISQKEGSYFFRPVSSKEEYGTVVGEEVELFFSQVGEPAEPEPEPESLPPEAPPGTEEPAPEAPVKQCPYLLEYLKIDKDNNPAEVSKLQKFLKEIEGHTYLEVSGVFDQKTLEAVNIFQVKYRSDILEPWGVREPTGYVYITTLKKINELYCLYPFALTEVQQAEIDAFRQQAEKPEKPEGPEGPATTTEPLPDFSEVGLGKEPAGLELKEKLALTESGLLAKVDQADQDGAKGAKAGFLTIGLQDLLDVNISGAFKLLLAAIFLVALGLIILRLRRAGQVVRQEVSA